MAEGAKTAKEKPLSRPTRDNPYWVNDCATFYWEIVYRNGVVKIVEKDFEDTNRAEAVAAARRINRNMAARRKAKVVR